MKDGKKNWRNIFYDCRLQLWTGMELWYLVISARFFLAEAQINDPFGPKR